MKTGQTYTTNLDPAEALEVIQDECWKMRHFGRPRTENNGSSRLETRLSGFPFYECIRRLPRRIVWRVWQTEDSTYIYCQPCLGSVYYACMLLLCVIFCVVFVIGMENAVSDLAVKRLGEVPGDMLLILTSFMVLAALVNMLLGGSQDRLQPVFTRLRYLAFKSGGHLSESRPIAVGHATRLLSLLLIVLSVCAFLMFRLGPPDANESLQSTIVQLMFLVISGSLIVAFLAMMIRRGISLRILPALGGLATFIAITFLLAMHLPWLQYSGRQMPSILAHLRRLPQSELLRLRETLDLWMDYSIISSAVALTLACALIAGAIRVAYRSFEYLHQMAERPDLQWSRIAARGEGFRRGLCIMLCILWPCLGVIEFVLLRSLFQTTIAVVSPFYTLDVAPLRDPASISAGLISLRLYGNMDSAWLNIVLHGIWIVYLVVCWSVVLLPLLALLRKRIWWLKLIRQGNSGAEAVAQRVNQRLDALYAIRRTRNSRPFVIIRGGSSPAAAIRRVGLFGHKHALIMNSWYVTKLDDARLDAVLAHELAHMELGHPQANDRYRLLGRLTLLGDSMGHIIQDSVGNEERADNFAVTEYHISRATMEGSLRALVNLRAVRFIGKTTADEDALLAVAGNSARGEFTKYVMSTSWIQRLRIGWRVYLGQYFSWEYSGYWHPSIDARIQALPASDD